MQATISPPVRMGYRPEIDGLRGVAVLAVIINHFNDKLLPGGYLGVDVFFVISGFVITASLAARNSTSFAELFQGFYARRVRRLLPALILFVLISGLFICFLMPDPGGTLAMGRRALFGVSNIQLYLESVQYFSESAKLNPYTHTWSLGVEEHFICCSPSWFR
jgi:peptidoglycan/LPS O-acetylase OafA/YrhL